MRTSVFGIWILSAVLAIGCGGGAPGPQTSSASDAVLPEPQPQQAAVYGYGDFVLGEPKSAVLERLSARGIAFKESNTSVTMVAEGGSFEKAGYLVDDYPQEKLFYARQSLMQYEDDNGTVLLAFDDRENLIKIRVTTGQAFATLKQAMSDKYGAPVSEEHNGVVDVYYWKPRGYELSVAQLADGSGDRQAIYEDLGLQKDWLAREHARHVAEQRERASQVQGF